MNKRNKKLKIIAIVFCVPVVILSSWLILMKYSKMRLNSDDIVVKLNTTTYLQNANIRLSRGVLLAIVDNLFARGRLPVGMAKEEQLTYVGYNSLSNDVNFDFIVEDLNRQVSSISALILEKNKDRSNEFFQYLLYKTNNDMAISTESLSQLIISCIENDPELMVGVKNNITKTSASDEIKWTYQE